MKGLREVSHGEEIDVEVTIDEEEYRQVLWDLVLLKAKGNSVKTVTKRQRRHSVCCGRDFPEKVGKPMDVTQIQIRVGRPLTELEISIRNIKRLKEALRGKEFASRIAEVEEQRLSEIERQLSEMEIFLAASSFSEIRMKEAEKRSPSEYITKSIPSVERRLHIAAASCSSEIGLKEADKRHFAEDVTTSIQACESMVETNEVAASCSSEIGLKEADKRHFAEDVTTSIQACIRVKEPEERDFTEYDIATPGLSESKSKEAARLSAYHFALHTTQGKLPAGSSLTSSSEYYKKGDFISLRELKLREYQKELAAPALEGKNTIICEPTNSNKTFVAMKIVKRHLDACKILKIKSNVIVVVDKQISVFQQRACFEEYLTNYSISDISGSNSDVIPLHRRIQDNDVVVVTAGILMNAMVDKSVHITDITLLVFDECHHANKDHPYSQIMQAYLETKLYDLETKKLPQVVGFTASLGATTKEQVLQICANMDASNISTVCKNTEELKLFSPQPLLETKKTQIEKKPNIFEKELNKAMEKIEVFIKETPPQAMDRQVEGYRQWIKLLEKKGEGNQLACASQLRCYHEALLINSKVRIEDAILYLDEYINDLDKSKFTETEYWLQELYLETKERIKKHIKEAGRPENPLLIALQKMLLDFHTTKAPEEYKPKGILFTRTREYAYALKKWMEESEELKEILRPEVLLGVAAVTQSQQEQVIQSFKEGTVNIIIATTVAEEGLDISDCSYVIRYGFQESEISSVQSKERKRRSREMLLELVLRDIKDIPSEKFQKLIRILQIKSFANKKPGQETGIEKSSLKDADGVTFYCQKCMALVCHAQDIRRFKESHHVVINKDIHERIDIKPHEKPKTFDGIHFGNRIYCKKCGHYWGVIITVEETEWPCLEIVSFVTTFNHGKEKKSFKKWKDLPIKICDATLKEMLTEAS
ncbi:interferon-induced helicase C domain-containing protein 1-like isoform X2 [Actinia tenebrosa]|uniref:RNA helicase n=1 Tax=Actinia tenebrosa TaxID=6105 RepID=A0A6P8I521_ACTTE|nr:interferon-induced helicase C domain-containing protein 1-like isoform X2 [Actinia tenebrosa]